MKAKIVTSSRSRMSIGNTHEQDGPGTGSAGVNGSSQMTEEQSERKS